MTLLKVSHLTIRQGQRELIRDLNWEIQEGEHWVLFGLNGCGKTTLLTYLSGFLPAEEGEIEFSGIPVTEENRRCLRKKIGWVSGSFFGRFYHSETVLEIVLSGLFGMLGLQREIRDEEVKRAKELLRAFDLFEKARYPMDLLSKGQQEKVYIARALMSEVKPLILDEPCSGMDLLARERFLDLVEQLSEKQGISLIYVTHHTEEILPIFKKAALMKDGTFFAAGDLRKVFQKPVLDPFFRVPSEVIWTDRHFLIQFEREHSSRREYSFLSKEGGRIS